MSTPEVDSIVKRDWCHLCGIRAERAFANVWYPPNAEHDRKCTKHIRVCSRCAELIADSVRTAEATT